MKTRCFLLVTMLIVLTNHAQTTYYVDATNGVDTNNGTSVETAWKTINRVNEQDYTAGDHILFKRDETWSGSRLYIENISGSLSDTVVYGAYGVGAKPIISSVIPQAHTWTQTMANIWKATNPPSENPERMLINGTERLRANILSELDGITYYWLYDDANDLYIYSNTDPNEFTIEYSTDFPIIVGYSNYITIRDLDIQGGWTGIFMNTLSKHIYLDSLRIGKYCREGVIISGDSTNPSNFPENIVIENCEFDAQFNFDYSTAEVYPESSDRGCSDGFRASVLKTAELKNCIFKNWGHASISIVSSHVSDVSIHDNYLTSPDICYGGRLNVDDAHHNEIYNNQIFNTSVQSQLNGQYNHYHHNIFYGTSNSPLKPSIIDAGIELQAYANSVVIENIYENNLFVNIEGPGFRISGNNTHEIYANNIRNNIIYNCGIVTDGESLVVESDLFEITHNNLFQNNLIFNSATNQTCSFRGALFDVDTFNLQTGIDGYLISNNIAENPQFMDVNNYEYYLQENSPCIDAGTTTLATFDYEGNAIPFAGTDPDIGIYEYQSVIAIDDYLIDYRFVLYPNPTKKFIHLLGDTSEIKELSIINSTGKIVLNLHSINKIIDLSSLLNGIYLVRFKTTSGVLFKKIMVLD